MNKIIEQLDKDGVYVIKNAYSKSDLEKMKEIALLYKENVIKLINDKNTKSSFYKNLLKSQCVLEKGYDFEFWIYDVKKDLSILDSKLITNKNAVLNELQPFI